ncbi:MAG: HAD family hydrolase [Nitrospirae bacterium]|nr:HAD family hydrolase [Nitrospirota bacterium]
MCRGLDKEDTEKANGTIEEFSRKVYRTIAVARSAGNDLDNLKLAGLLSLADPPRPDSKSMIEQARKLGIKPILLTGDSMAIAQEIALQAGIGGNIIRMADIKGLTDDEQMKVVGESDGFALLGIYGVFVPSLTLHQVLMVLGFSALFTLCIDFPKYYLFRKFAL